MRKLMIAAAAVAAAATPAFAQVNTSGGLVNVSVQNVDILKNFLNNDQIAALNNVQLPITVQVPVGVAANVCGVSAAVLGKAASDALDRPIPTTSVRTGSVPGAVGSADRSEYVDPL